MSREYDWEEQENEELKNCFNGAYGKEQQPESYTSYLKDLFKKLENGESLIRLERGVK